MSPLESRNSENINRVRCFYKDALMPDVRDDKWDLVKVTCTQPYNKRVQYGLCFVKIHTPDESNVAHSIDEKPKLNTSCEEVLDLPKENVFSQFKFREESPESDKETNASSSLFAKWKQTKQSTTDDIKSRKNIVISFVIQFS